MTGIDVDPPITAVRPIVAAALAEDLSPLGDLTGGLVSQDLLARANFAARHPGVLAGSLCAIEVCRQVSDALQCSFVVGDGTEVQAGMVIGEVSGPLPALLIAERSALNFLSHLSGIATSTKAFVRAATAVNPKVRIWDTRKTTPGLRSLEKAAVRAGGGVNHRGNLSDGVLVKDNHLGGLTIEQGVHLALQRWPGRMVEVECDHLDQVTQALDAGASVVMMDNMSPSQTKQGVDIVRSHRRGDSVLIEASGTISLDNVAQYAATGVDLISVGTITHSAPILDIGLDLIVS